MQGNIMSYSDYLFAGKYKEIIKNLEKTLNSLDQLWVLLEAFIVLGEFEKASSFLNSWKKHCNSFLELSKWYYYNGLCELSKNNVERAGEVFLQALSYAVESSDPLAVLQEYTTRIQIGRCNWRLGKYHLAVNEFIQAIPILEKTKNPLIISEAYLGLGAVYFDQGKYLDALELYKKALSIRMSSNNPYLIVPTLNNIGNCYATLGYLAKALGQYQQALDMARQNNLSRYMAGLINNSAVIFQIQGYYSKALVFHQESLERAKKLNSLSEIATSLNNIGLIYRAQGKLDEAHEVLEKALEIRKESKHQYNIAGSIIDLALVLSDMNMLTEDSPLLQLFPNEPYETELIAAFKYMIYAIIEQKKRSLRNSEALWLKALSYNGLEFDYKLLCYESLAEITLLILQREWSEENLRNLTKHLDTIETLSKANNLIASLCKTLLLRAKLSMAKQNFEEAEKFLLLSMTKSIDMGLPLHLRIIKEEFLKLNSYKNVLVNIEMEESKSKEFRNTQLIEFHVYLKEITKILNSLQETAIQ